MRASPRIGIVPLLAGGAGLLFALSPRPVPQVIDELVNIRFFSDVRIFAAMAAINIAGFDIDEGALEQGSARMWVRDELARLDPHLRDRLRAFYEKLCGAGDDLACQSKVVSYALLLEGPPDFGLESPLAEIPEEVKPLVGFELLLREFWDKGALAQLWEQVRPLYVREALSYKPLIQKMIVETLASLRTSARVSLDRRVIFVPDLLNAFGVVNARNVTRMYFVIVGPSKQNSKPLRSVRHEYLHFLLDPLVSKYRGYLPEPDPFLERAKAQPMADEAFAKDFLLLVGESLIRAVEIRLESSPRDRGSSRVIEEYERGLILTPYFLAALDDWETGEDSLQEFFPDLIEGVTWDAEKGREQEVLRAKEELASRREKAAAHRAEEARRIREIANRLKRANGFLLEKRYGEAEALLNEVLALEGTNTNALFGMAQIAGQRQALDQALALYEQAAAHADDQVWIAAWSFLRRGNIYRLQGDIDRAAHEWSKVLELEGDLRGAAEEAQKAIARIKK